MSLAHRRLRFCLPAAQPFPNGLLIFVLTLFALLPAPARADVTPFKTPSGNIQCYIGDSGTATDLQCAIFEFSAAPALPRPASCAAPWGHSYILLEQGPVTMVCGGPGPKNTAPGVDIAPYGVSADGAAFPACHKRPGCNARTPMAMGFCCRAACSRSGSRAAKTGQTRPAPQLQPHEETENARDARAVLRLLPCAARARRTSSAIHARQGGC